MAAATHSIQTGQPVVMTESRSEILVSFDRRLWRVRKIDPFRGAVEPSEPINGVRIHAPIPTTLARWAENRLEMN